MKYIFLIIALFVATANGAFAQDTFKADSKNSVVRWEGNKLVGGHWGNISIKSGSLKMNNGKLTGGEFVLDMKTIVVLDLNEDQGKSKLEGHLMSDDFFSTDKFPTSKLVITRVAEISNAKSGSPNYNITGNLTIRDKTHSITFPATVELKSGVVTAKADISIDRTKWDVKYNSGNFFKDLGDRMIKDEIKFNVNLSAKK